MASEILHERFWAHCCWAFQGIRPKSTFSLAHDPPPQLQTQINFSHTNRRNVDGAFWAVVWLHLPSSVLERVLAERFVLRLPNFQRSNGMIRHCSSPSKWTTNSCVKSTEALVLNWGSSRALTESYSDGDVKRAQCVWRKGRAHCFESTPNSTIRGQTSNWSRRSRLWLVCALK